MTTATHAAATMIPTAISSCQPDAMKRPATMAAGMTRTKPSRPNPTRAAMFSPHVRRSREADCLRPAMAPRSSMTMAGTVRKVTTSQAISSMWVTIRPSQPARSLSAWRTSPTVVVMIAHGTRPGMRANARPMALRTVGSPPVSRSWAPATSAPLKNTATTPRTRAAAM